MEHEIDNLEEAMQDIESDAILKDMIDNTQICPGCQRIMDIDTVNYNGTDFYCALCDTRLD